MASWAGVRGTSGVRSCRCPNARRRRPDENVVTLPDRAAAAPPQDDAFEEVDELLDSGAGEQAGDARGIAAGLSDISGADASFDVDAFLSGARVAYEMIVDSFANNDTDALRPLLDAKVYKSFADSIGEREARNETLETTLVALESADIVEARLGKRLAKLTVKFVSEVVSVTRDADGEIVSGDPRVIDKVTELWTFARETGGSDPNWKLVSTRSPE